MNGSAETVTGSHKKQHHIAHFSDDVGSTGLRLVALGGTRENEGLCIMTDDWLRDVAGKGQNQDL